MLTSVSALFYQSLGTTAFLAALLCWLARRRAPEKQPGPASVALTLASPWLIGHLLANGLNYFFPPAAGVDWLLAASALWVVLMVLSPIVTGLLFGPERWGKYRDHTPAALTLILAVTVYFVSQQRLPWIFSEDEIGNTRPLVALGIAFGGGVMCVGYAALARLLPAGGFHLCTAALAVPLAAALQSAASPAWIAIIQLLPAAAAAGFLLGGWWRGPVPVPFALWCGLTTGLPFLWGGVSRFPSVDPLLPILAAALPAAVAILLLPLRRRFHPVGLAFTAAAALLAGGTLILRESPPPPPPPSATATGADDSGAYE